MNYNYKVNYHHELRSMMLQAYTDWISKDKNAKKHPSWIGLTPKFHIRWHNHWDGSKGIGVDGDLMCDGCRFEKSKNHTYFKLINKIMRFGFGVRFDGRETAWIYSLMVSAVQPDISLNPRKKRSAV